MVKQLNYAILEVLENLKYQEMIQAQLEALVLHHCRARLLEVFSGWLLK